MYTKKMNLAFERLLVMFIFTTTAVFATIDEQKRQAILGEVEARHLKVIELMDAGKFDEAAKFHSVDTLFMPNMGKDANGRAAYLESLKERMPHLVPLKSEDIQYSEVFDENTAVVYHHVASVDQFEKPWARYRLFVIYKNIGGEWLVDSLIFNNRPLSDE